nr:MAG TPA: hypothetical protein [Bacteriophage sp.]
MLQLYYLSERNVREANGNTIRVSIQRWVGEIHQRSLSDLSSNQSKI